MDDLIEQAKILINEHYKQGAHHVACVLRTKSGKIFKGVHLESQKVDICAEWVAVGNAMLESNDPIVQIVAVKRFESGEVNVLPPCSLCRDLLLMHAPDAEVAVSDKECMSPSELFPNTKS